jgi:hypothetical protein
MAISEFLDRDFARRWASALPFNRKASARPLAALVGTYTAFQRI